MNATRPTREDLDAAGLRTVVAYAIAPLERDLRRAEAKLEWVRSLEIAPPALLQGLAAVQVARLRDALDLAREIAAGMKLRR